MHPLQPGNRIFPGFPAHGSFIQAFATLHFSATVLLSPLNYVSAIYAAIYVTPESAQKEMIVIKLCPSHDCLPLARSCFLAFFCH